jgi:hypothetical protein
MGAIMAVKSLLSLSALQSLHQKNPALDIDSGLRPLSPLLTGLFEKDQPIQILHLSFCDSITRRTQSSLLHRHFHVSERAHNQRLSILCLHVLDEDLTSHTPGIGYLTVLRRDIEGIPSVDKSQISEVLWYACRFWTEHIIEIEAPVSVELLDGLHRFLATKLTVWMEVLSTQYPFQTLSNVRAWVQVSDPTQAIL